MNKAFKRLGTLGVAALLGIGLIGAAPVPASDVDCWGQLNPKGELVDTLCVPSGESLDQAVFDEFGFVIVDDFSNPIEVNAAVARGAVAPKAIYSLGTLYMGQSYTGSSFTATASTPCTGYPNLNVSFWNLEENAPGLNNNVESLQRFNGCRVSLWDGFAGLGVKSGPYTSNVLSLGSFNNLASSACFGGINQC